MFKQASNSTITILNISAKCLQGGKRFKYMKITMKHKYWRLSKLATEIDEEKKTTETRTRWWRFGTQRYCIAYTCYTHVYSVFCFCLFYFLFCLLSCHSFFRFFFIMRCNFIYLFISFACRAILHSSFFFQTECHSIVLPHTFYVFAFGFFFEFRSLFIHIRIALALAAEILFSYTHILCINFRYFFFYHCFCYILDLLSYAGQCTLANYPSIFHFKRTISIVELSNRT